MGTPAGRGIIESASLLASDISGEGADIDGICSSINRYILTIRGGGELVRTELRHSTPLHKALGAISESALDSYRVQIAIGNLFFEIASYDAAYNTYHKARIAKETREVLNNLGVISSRLGDQDSAIGFYQQSIELEKDNSQSWFNLGKAQYRKGSIQEAIKAFKRAVELDPKNKSAWNNLGVCFRIDGRIEEAIGSYDKAISIDSVYVWAWDNKGNALMEIGRNQEAMDCFIRALKIDPNYTSAIKNKQECEGRLGKKWSLRSGKDAN